MVKKALRPESEDAPKISIRGAPLPANEDFLRAVELFAPAPPPSPPVPAVLELFQPFSVESSLINPVMQGRDLDIDLEARVTEKKTGAGVPFTPITIYINGETYRKVSTDGNGEHLETISLTEHRSTVEVKHLAGIPFLPKASDTSTVIWDNFDDNELAPVWRTFGGSGPWAPDHETREENERLEFMIHAVYDLTGAYIEEPIDIAKRRISVRLYSDHISPVFIDVLPAETKFYMTSYNHGYDFGIWENLGGPRYPPHLMVYGPEGGGKAIIYERRSLRSNPVTLEIFLDGDGIIHFYEAGDEVYAEEYRASSTICNIYLHAHYWWYKHYREPHVSWADNLLIRDHQG